MASNNSLVSAVVVATAAILVTTTTISTMTMALSCSPFQFQSRHQYHPYTSVTVGSSPLDTYTIASATIASRKNQHHPLLLSSQSSDTDTDTDTDTNTNTNTNTESTTSVKGGRTADNNSDRRQSCWSSSPPVDNTYDNINRITETSSVVDTNSHTTTLYADGVLARRMFFASSLIGVGVSLRSPESAVAAVAQQQQLPPPSNIQKKKSSEFLWQKSPINPKRTNFRVNDAERCGYNVNFVTYLSRFLLCFDPAAQQWWMDRAQEIPNKNTITQDEIFRIRTDQFAKFAASVEVGLQEDNFVGKDGPKTLLESLLKEFGGEGVPLSDVTSTVDDTTANTYNSNTNDPDNRFTRETKEARRQLALMFGLLEESQPTKEITTLLASIDNGYLGNEVILSNDARSNGLLRKFSPEDTPVVEFPLPQAGPGYIRASGEAVLKPTGKLLRIEIMEGGEGYAQPPDLFEVLSLQAVEQQQVGGENDVAATAAVATATIASNGTLTAITLLNYGSGYNENRIIEKKLDAPDGGKAAIIRIVPEMEISKINILSEGTGYAVEKPVKVKLVEKDGGREPEQTIGIVYPKGQMGSFVRDRSFDNKTRNFERTFIKDNNNSNKVKVVISGASSGGTVPSAPFPEKASSSSQLLALLPQGYGLEFDTQKNIYILSVDEEYQKLYPQMILNSPNRPLVPDFGPRGRSPIERNEQIDLPTFLRFCLSGAICSSGVNLALTPLDVVKTKVQIDPQRYPTILPSFRSVWTREGPTTFFTGWLPTLSGHFFAGGVLYGTTEVIRRYLTDAAGVNAVSLEVPIILAAASIASGTAAILYCPFDAVRIRSVAQPSYGTNAIEIVSRMVKEEGIEVLIDAIPVFVAKQVPYAAVKFTIFDLTTEYLYRGLCFYIDSRYIFVFLLQPVVFIY